MTVFIYGFINKIIYVVQPHQFVLKSEQVRCVRKAFLDENALNLIMCVCLTRSILFSCYIYVHDLFFFSSDDCRLTDIEDQLNSPFMMTNSGEISHYLDIDVLVEVGKNSLSDRLFILQKNWSAFRWPTASRGLFP